MKKKGVWLEVGIISAVVLCLSFVINVIVLFQIYGCAGASLTEPTTGLCSTVGLNRIQVVTVILEVLIYLSLAGTVAGFIAYGILSGRKK